MPETNRLFDAIRRIIRSEFPSYAYHGIYEYAVQSASSMKVDATPVDTSLGLPFISNIPIKSSIMGETVTPTVGNVVLVAFVNGSPSRPVVIGCEATNQAVSSKASLTMTLDAPAMQVGPGAVTVQVAGVGPPAARIGDHILVLGIFDGVIVTGSTKVTVGG